MTAARRIAGRVARAGGVLVDVEDSRMTSARCDDGSDILDDLLACVGDDGDKIVEFSFGTNSDIDGALDWSVNSQINEGASGVHIALGDGVTGAHVDFVRPGATVAFAGS
jgi:hypothetical protein